MDNNIEQQAELLNMIQKFYARVGAIANDPTQVSQEEGVKLLAESDAILKQINDMPYLERGAALVARFTQIKHMLTYAMVSSPERKQAEEE